MKSLPVPRPLPIPRGLFSSCLARPSIFFSQRSNGGLLPGLCRTPQNL